MENKPQEHFKLGVATENVLKLKAEGTKALIALGDWIQIVKDNLPATEWLDWLKYEVEIPVKYAYKLMQAAKTISYRQLEQLKPEKLTISKIFEIMALPDGQFKEELIERAPDMTIKEIREAKQEVTTSGQEEVVRIDSKVRSVLELNADFLDMLKEIKLETVSSNFLDLLENQLKTNVCEVSGILNNIKNVRTAS